MAASAAEQLFSLELLVDWVRLEAGRFPPPAEPGTPRHGEETASPRDLCPVVAFRLLDFPTLLVYPPGGPAAPAPAPAPRPGLLRFSRGKACLFRLHPATLHRSLLRTPLHTLLLQQPPGRPAPAPQQLGACSVSLAAAARHVAGSAASGASRAARGTFPLRNRAGERVGDIALGYRLTALGSGLLGPLERTDPRQGEGEGAETRAAQGTAPSRQDQQLPASLVDFTFPEAPQNAEEIVSHAQAHGDSTGSEEASQTHGVCTRGSASIPHQKVAELDFETNVICPPPLYYTNFAQEKTASHVPGKITIRPQMNIPEERNGAFPEEKRVNSSTCGNSLGHADCTISNSPPGLLNPPNGQNIGAANQTEQSRIGIISQLPLLNALLVELSLLYNQPMARPLHVHPQLAWLYSSEHNKPSESPAKSSFENNSREDKLSVGGNEKAMNLEHKKNQVENPKNGKRFEEKNDLTPKRVRRGKLLYGLTNTLKLRLKQTNPAMLAVHEKREQSRKMQAQMLGAKLKIPSSKALNSTKQHQQLPQLPKDRDSERDASLAKYSDSSKPASGGFDDPSSNKENKLNHTSEKTVDCGKNRTSDTSPEEIVSPADSSIPEKCTHANVSERKVEMKAPSPCSSQQVAVERIVVHKQVNDGETETNANEHFYVGMSENKVSKNSSSENISLMYSDDFASCYSEDFCTTEDTSRILPVHDSSSRTDSPEHSQYKSKSSVTRLSKRENCSERDSIIRPPFSAGSPVHSHERSYIAKIQDRSLEEASSSDLSSLPWTEEKETQEDQSTVHNSKFIRSNQVVSVQTRNGCKSLERSQSPQTSQVSSYMPSNLSDMKFNILDISSISDHLEEDSDEVGSLNISKQCKDICELVINKLPGYTM